MTKLNLRIVPGRYGVARLPAGADVPDWFNGPGFAGFVRADDEVTVICAEDRIPDTAEVERGWACLRSVGPFPFEAAGIVSALIAPISAAGIGVFVLCTFDGEHILVPSASLEQVQGLLAEAGHRFVDPSV